MREFCLRLLLIVLLVLMWLYHCVVWKPAKSLATFLAKQLEALELALLVAGTERRTRNEREMK